MTDESLGRQLHAEALRAREQKRFEDALILGNETLRAYLEEKDFFSYAEAMSMQAKTYLHMFELEPEKYPLFDQIAIETALASVAIAELTGDPSAPILPYFNLGKISEDLGDLEIAVDALRKAVVGQEKNPSPRHNRPAVLADFRGHLAAAEYKSGDKGALIRAQKAIDDLVSAEGASQYERDVWLSGAHMRIAEMLLVDNREQAREHLAKAKEIIERNPELVIRKEQLEKLSSSF